MLIKIAQPHRTQKHITDNINNAAGAQHSSRDGLLFVPEPRTSSCPPGRGAFKKRERAKSTQGSALDSSTPRSCSGRRASDHGVSDTSGRHRRSAAGYAPSAAPTDCGRSCSLDAMSISRHSYQRNSNLPSTIPPHSVARHKIPVHPTRLSAHHSRSESGGTAQPSAATATVAAVKTSRPRHASFGDSISGRSRSAMGLAVYPSEQTTSWLRQTTVLPPADHTAPVQPNFKAEVS